MQLIYIALQPTQQILVRDFMEDPSKMWETLEAHHMQKKPSSRFTVYESLFNIVKQDNESLPALCARVDDAMHTVRNLCTKDFTVQNLDDEPVCLLHSGRLSFSKVRPQWRHCGLLFS